MPTHFRHFNSKKYPKLIENDIVEFVDNVVFNGIDSSALTNHEFFSDINKIFSNIGAVLLHFSASDKRKFGQCIHWFGIGEKVMDDLEVNIVLNKLLSNKTLKENPLFLKLTEGFLDYNDVLGRNIKKANIEEISPYSFDGELAEIIYNGGAYVKHLYSASKTKKRSKRFVDKLIQNRFDNFRIYGIYRAWSNWFAGINWDYTYLIFDELKGEFWILAISDTD